MDSKTANRLPLTDILARLGHNPERKDGEEWWYHSPFRQEDTPSFRVNTRFNRWKDWGRGDLRERSVIDFMIVLHDLGERDVHGAITELEHLMGSGYTINPLKQREHSTDPKPSKTHGITIERTQPLRHKHLLEYLTVKRCLTNPRILEATLEEVYFINHAVSSTTLFYAIGFKNDADGYELRNARFKGSAAPKCIRTITGVNTHEISVFEGWTDYISFLHHHQCVNPPTDCLILNSTKLLQQAIEVIGERGETCTAIKCYPHHDEEGRAVIAVFQKALPHIPLHDKSTFYAGFNDYNDWWQSRCQSTQQERA